MADDTDIVGHVRDDLTIFISYRRADTRADAGRLYDALRRRFGKEQLFMDVDTLQPGQDWVSAVEDAVARCDVLLALIGDEWATVVDPSGRRRIEDDLDRVRLEIEAALKQDKPVIPVLFDDAHMPGRDELPESLESLRRRHAMRLAHDTFRYDLERLVRSLRTIESAKRAKVGAARDPGRATRKTATDSTPPARPARPRRPTLPPPAPTRSEPVAATPPIAPAVAGLASEARPLPAQVTPPIAAASAESVPSATAQATPATPWAYYPQAAVPYPPAPPQHAAANPSLGPWSGQPQPAWQPTRKTGASASPWSLSAIILGVLSVPLFALAIILGPIGIVLGIVGKTKNEPWSTAGIIVAVVGMIIGVTITLNVY